MSRETILARGRAAALAGMVDTCLIRRRTGQSTNRETGVITPTYLDPDPYAGPCRVQQSSPAASEVQAGGARLLMVDRVLQLPVDASAEVKADDEVTIVAVHASSDPALLGKRFVVKVEYAKTHATSRKLGIEEATS